jgi:hypothetical protein
MSVTLEVGSLGGLVTASGLGFRGDGGDSDLNTALERVIRIRPHRVWLAWWAPTTMKGWGMQAGQKMPHKRRHGVLAGAAGALLSALVLIGLISPGAALGSVEDRESTQAYLTAAYEEEQTTVANLGVSKTGLEALMASVGDECAGVLAGAHDPSQRSRSFARRFGEEQRIDEQQGDLEEELGVQLEQRWSEPNRQASVTFAEKVVTLRWTNVAVDRLVAADVAEIDRALSAPTPAACADMKAWAASGYRTLSAASKAFQHEREAHDQHVIRGSTIVWSKAPPDPLQREEERYDKPLLLKIQALEREDFNARRDLSPLFRQLQLKLGIHRSLEVEHHEGPPAGSVVFAHRRTFTGERYSVELVRNAKEGVPTGGHGRRCRLGVEIHDSEGEAASACVSSRDHSPEQGVNCSEGVLTISAVTLPAARTVRLRLSEGRQATSKAIRVPRRLGGSAGDAGLYFQEVKGPKPIPLALEELGAKGRVLRRVKLPKIVECTRPTLRFLHNGIKSLAHGRLPIAGLPRFTIQGEAYRFLGSIQFKLQVWIENEGGGGESLGGRRRKLFDFGIWQSCQPHPYAIVYGLLYSHDDAVFARTPSGLVRLHRVSIPRHLHAHGGVLVYTAQRSVPTALIVRDGHGRTLLRENLRSQSREARETCEGESEGQVTSGKRVGARGPAKVVIVGSGSFGEGIPAPPAVRRAGGRELREFKKGRTAFAAAGCLACHRIGENGNHGPGRALTHIGSQLTERQIRHALVDPTAPMPSFKALPRHKLHALVRFLSLLR